MPEGNLILRFLKKHTATGLEEYLTATKKVSVCGVPFVIRKISVLDHLEGCNVLYQMYSTYKTSKDRRVNEDLGKQFQKARKHYVDVIMSGVVSPVLSRKPEGEGIHIERILNDWVLSIELVNQILNYTYSKKK